jgi:hypothetical protein
VIGVNTPRVLGAVGSMLLPHVCTSFCFLCGVGCGVQAAPVQGSQSPFERGSTLAGGGCTQALHAAVAVLQVALGLLSLSGVSCTDCASPLPAVETHMCRRTCTPLATIGLQLLKVACNKLGVRISRVK